MATTLDSQRERFEADPSDARAFQALEEHFFLEGSWEALARVYEQRIAALTADDAALRGDTADLLGKIGLPSAVEPLRGLLADENPDVAEIAQEAIDAIAEAGRT